MKINKLFLMAGLALLGFVATSCGDDDDYTPGAASGIHNITFPDQENYALDLDASEFTVNIQRENGSGELTVPLKVNASKELSVPSSVTFANGETQKEITVQVSEEAKAFVDYYLVIDVPAEFAQPYKGDNDAPSRLQITVHKEDYVEYGTGYYYTWYWDMELEASVDYSAYLNLYRFNDVFAYGYNVYVRVTENHEFEICDENGNAIAGANFPIGVTNPTYGPMYLRWVLQDYEDYTYYVPEYDLYQFVTQYRVAAGSFGTNIDYFYIIPNE